MNNLRTIIKFELMRYFLSPLAYVYLISFLFLSGSCAIYFGHFFVNGQADLWSLFNYQPWIYLLFVPCISMRSWSEEFRSKSIIQLLTAPVDLRTLVLGKFFASWIFIIIAISLTFPFWITANLYGNPDNMVIFIGYLSCFVLSGAMLAISQTMSSLTQNSIISLVSAVFVNLLFFWSGFEYVLFWASKLFSPIVVDTIISFSFLTHFSSFCHGLVELRDLVFFVSLIVFFNLLTMAFINLKTRGVSTFVSSSSKFNVFALILLFVGFLGLNVIANNVFRQINYDFTEEKYLSLTKNTKNILRQLERPVIARFYYSPILGQRNPKVRFYFDQIKLLLKQYKLYSHGNFDYQIYYPQFLDKMEDRALADGLQPIPLVDINQNALFGIVFSDALTNKSVIPFFPIERAPFIEQDLTTGIYKLQHKKKTLGLLSSLPVMGGVRKDEVFIQRWEIINKINELYNIKEIKKPEDIDQIFDVFVLIHPHNLSEDYVQRIKQQQKILLLLDVADDASRIYSPENGAFIPSDLPDDLSNYWHIKFYSEGVAADFNNSITVDETINYKTNPSFTQDLLQFKISENGLIQNHRITYKLSNILFSSASTILPTDVWSISFFPLVKTSDVSALMTSEFATKSSAPKDILAQFKPQNNPIYIAAEILSHDPLKPFDIIAVADTDFIYDSFWSKQRRFLDSVYYVPFFDNANFVLNALDYLSENDDLISLRGKSAKSRPLYKIEDMRKKNIYRYKLKESDIFQAIDGTRQRLIEISTKKDFENRKNFTPDEMAIIGKIRQEISALRQQLSDLRIKANQNLELIEIKVKFFDIYFIPLLVLFLLMFAQLSRSKFLSLLKNTLVWNSNTSKIFLYVALITALAILTVVLDNKSNISKYEDAPVFKDFSNKINKISKIHLKKGTKSLNFSRINGVWYLDDFAALPVYQERIRSLLMSLNNMTFFEKKSDKTKDMHYFGFSSDKNSPTLSISLLDDQDNPLEEFDVGWYDIDIGRGGRAAYIRLKNQFQIWLAEVDFYDLSIEKEAWTYSTLWNLRFGRFASYNGVYDEKKIINLAKNLLNIYLEDVVDSIEATRFAEIKLDIENNNFINLVFYKTDQGKYYVQYDFVAPPKGKHLEFFARFVENKFLEISPQSWELIKDDSIKSR